MVRTEPHILIVEDDPATQRLERLALEQEGFAVTLADSGKKALEALAETGADLVLLDVGLPDMDGFATCQHIRQFSQVPVIFVSGRHLSDDKVQGLEIGADSYLYKPLSPAELTAAVKATLRRTYNSGSPRGPITRPTSSTPRASNTKVNVAGQEVSLSGMEYRLLYRLAHHTARLHLTFSRLQQKRRCYAENLAQGWSRLDAYPRCQGKRLWKSDPVTRIRDFRRAGANISRWYASGPKAWSTNAPETFANMRTVLARHPNLTAIESWLRQLLANLRRLKNGKTDHAWDPASASPNGPLAAEQIPWIEEDTVVAADDPQTYSSGSTVNSPSNRHRQPAFQPEVFLQRLFDAYVKFIAPRNADPSMSPPVVPLVDIYPLITLPIEQAQEYSTDKYTEDIYRLHRCGLDTTETGAKISFPISRGVPGKTLTNVSASGEEIRYYGVRFMPPEGSVGFNLNPNGALETRVRLKNVAEVAVTQSVNDCAAEEIQGLHIVQTLLHDVVDGKRIGLRRFKSYSTVVLDKNIQKPICRLRFGTEQKYLGLMDEAKREEQIAIGDMHEIFEYAVRLRTTAMQYQVASSPRQG